MPRRKVSRDTVKQRSAEAGSGQGIVQEQQASLCNEGNAKAATAKVQPGLWRVLTGQRGGKGAIIITRSAKKQQQVAL